MDTAMLDADKPNSSQKEKTSAAKPHRTRKLSALMNIHTSASSSSIQWKLLPQQQGTSLQIRQFCKVCGSRGKNFHCILKIFFFNFFFFYLFSFKRGMIYLKTWQESHHLVYCLKQVYITEKKGKC